MREIACLDWYRSAIACCSKFNLQEDSNEAAEFVVESGFDG